MQIHIIQRGETLWLLSERYGVSISQIATVNELPNPNSLVIGQALVIPNPNNEYVVEPGDSLRGIAQRYGIPVQQLMRANGITNPALVFPGQVLTIPVSHTVKPGETLSMIARRYGTTVPAIVRANGITDPNLIYPGRVLRVPDKFKPVIDVNAFTDRVTRDAAEEVVRVSRYLTYMSPFGYRIRPDGSLEPLNDSELIQAAISSQVVPMMTVTNFSATELGSQLAHTILSSPELQNTLLTNIINTMKSKKYAGVNIDFENVLPSDRELYNQFLRRAVARLHPEGFFVSSSLAPKSSGEQKGLLYEAHDYPAHGHILDFVILMTYEWGYRLGPPQPISPIDQIKAVLDYAVTVIPRHKILMGFQLYARDWRLPHVQGQVAETFSVQEAIRRAVKYGAEILYDQKSQSPFYRYVDEQGQRHEVWFEDARSAQAKFQLARDYNLRGISYWVLGYPFPQNWVLLANQFHIRKLR